MENQLLRYIIGIRYVSAYPAVSDTDTEFSEVSDPAAIAAIATALALLVVILLSVGIFICCRRGLRQAVAAEGEQLAGRSQVVVHMTATQVRA
jgi:hypothetical protein